jgi:hypothetical protein
MMGYLWRPEDTLYLSLQEALQIGEGQAIQDSDAGHFECSRVQEWELYESGTQTFTMPLRDDRPRPFLDIEPSEEDLDSAALAEELEEVDHGEPVASGSMGYMVVIDAQDQFVDTIVGSYEEAVALLDPFHPEPTKWEPGWQVENNLFVADWPNGPLHVEFHVPESLVR